MTSVEGAHILLVDDERAILETLQILFRNEGYKVSVCQSGPEALERLAEERPDIVLTDIRMPGATGLDDETYLDFVEGVRRFNVKTMGPALTRRADEAFAEYERLTGKPATSLEEAHALLDQIPLVQTRWRVVRTSQEMFWRGSPER